MIENTQFKKLALVGAMLLAGNVANAHVSYNTTGNGSAASGSPKDYSEAIDIGAPWGWSAGAPAYTGNLPVTWVAEIHNGGGAANSQTASSTGAGFTIGMGASAYMDGATNWGMTSDFGLINLHHDATVTITVASDLSNLRPAFGLWKGWDTGNGSRHGSYLANGALNTMAANPLGTTGLSLIDTGAFAVAGTQGLSASATLTRFLTAGNYTLILGGVNGPANSPNLAYTATISAAPVPLPAAVWMFGGALMGWLGLQKRKMAA